MKVKKIRYVICYGPLHGQDELEVVPGKTFAGKEFIFSGGVEPQQLLDQGWKHGTTWVCPDCVAERERKRREQREKEQAEQEKKPES